ncbi:hypothetical protein J6590_020589 [Homalodisca vitripennis]|nr:hypothetical protein J6590_020589 [Homalodisca vitripennis]
MHVSLKGLLRNPERCPQFYKPPKINRSDPPGEIRTLVQTTKDSVSLICYCRAVKEQVRLLLVTFYIADPTEGHPRCEDAFSGKLLFQEIMSEVKGKQMKAITGGERIGPAGVFTIIDTFDSGPIIVNSISCRIAYNCRDNTTH